LKGEVFKPLIYPGYQAPVILGADGTLSAESRFWGFITRIPGKKDPSKLLEKIMQNAVSETVDDKRTFSGAWKKNQRCIIPVKAFLEPKNKVFVPIHDPDQLPLSIAGIYSEVTYKGEKREAFTMLTCEPNKFMEPFHDRMPVILNDKDVVEWLSSETPYDQAKKLCRPYKGKLAFA
jgi:putative SOS response-associated peptidase YedK